MSYSYGSYTYTDTDVKFRALMYYTVTAGTTAYTVSLYGGMEVTKPQSPGFQAVASVSCSKGTHTSGTTSGTYQWGGSTLSADTYRQVVATNVWTIPRTTSDQSVTISLTTRKNTSANTSLTSTASATFTVPALPKYDTSVHIESDVPLRSGFVQMGAVYGTDIVADDDSLTSFSANVEVFHGDTVTVAPRLFLRKESVSLESCTVDDVETEMTETELDNAVSYSLSIPITQATDIRIRFKYMLGLFVKSEGEWLPIMRIHKRTRGSWEEVGKDVIDTNEIYSEA